MSDRADIELSIRFLSPDEGGRDVLPDLASGPYRPHLVLDGDPAATYLGVEIVACDDDLSFDVDVHVVASLPYERVDYSGLKPGASFKIREGARTVGEGVVVSR